MEKSRRFERTRFPEEVLREAAAVFRSQAAEGEDIECLILKVDIGHAAWQHDAEDEFFADYRRSAGESSYFLRRKNGELKVYTHVRFSGDAYVDMQVAAEDRSRIEAIMAVFERSADRFVIPEPPKPPPPKPTIFIGHGRSSLWRDLKDHLHEKHGYKVEAYEIGARAGHTVRDILEKMLARSTFALLVMTGEDEPAAAEGEGRVLVRARQNVVHEAGLFQGRLGFHRAVVLLEDGTEDFSNLHGLEQIRFQKGRIQETFGEVLATLRREFPERT